MPGYEMIESIEILGVHIPILGDNAFLVAEHPLLLEWAARVDERIKIESIGLLDSDIGGECIAFSVDAYLFGRSIPMLIFLRENSTEIFVEVGSQKKRFLIMNDRMEAKNFIDMLVQTTDVGPDKERVLLQVATKFSAEELQSFFRNRNETLETPRESALLCRVFHVEFVEEPSQDPLKDISNLLTYREAKLLRHLGII